MKKTLLVLAGCVVLMSVGGCVGKGKGKAPPPPPAAPVIVAPRG